VFGRLELEWYERKILLLGWRLELERCERKILYRWRLPNQPNAVIVSSLWPYAVPIH
jgi:hypothetical protein